MLAVAPEALKPGPYWWRWRPGQPKDGATEWSMVRAFTVPDGLPEVPFPDPDVLAKRLGTSRPRIMVRADEVEELRQRALAARQRWIEQVQDSAPPRQPLLPEPAFLPPPSDRTASHFTKDARRLGRSLAK
jgi:hypothetical protein